MKRLQLAPLALLLLGCGEDFEPAHQLQTLRVLAVQKSEPYARPGDQVDFSMLWHDARDRGPDFVADEDIHWFGGCVNPLGGAYAACYLDVAVAYLLRGLPPEQRPSPYHEYGQGETFAWQVPERTVFGEPVVQPGTDPNQPGYGSAYAFFAVCPGELELDPAVEGPVTDLFTRIAAQCLDPTLTPEEQQGCFGSQVMSDPTLFDLLEYQGFPLFCRDGDSYLGADDYVAGYSQVFVYETITNMNPTIDGVEFNGETPGACTCIDAACLGEPQCPADAVLPSVPPCADDGGFDCPEYVFRPLLDPSVAEPDTALSGGLREQMWVNYYVDAGDVSSPLRLLNEAELGWNDEYRTKFRAPADPGRVNLWAVVHDNRGGTAWVKQTINVVAQ